MDWDLLGETCVRQIRVLQIAKFLRCPTGARTDATSTTTDYRSRACRFTTSTEPWQAFTYTEVSLDFVLQATHVHLGKVST